MPAQETWYAKSPLIQIIVNDDGSYSRFFETDATYIKYSSDGTILKEKKYSQLELKTIIEHFRESLDFANYLGLNVFSKESWTLSRQGVIVKGINTDVYEMLAKRADKDQFQERKILVYVGVQTNLPVRTEVYILDKQSGDWIQFATAIFSYPPEIPNEVLRSRFSATNLRKNTP